MDEAANFCQGGCGLNSCMGGCADALEVVTPVAETAAKVFWCLGSPLAFPIIFCFDSDPHTQESSGWDVGMMQAPMKAPLTCCMSTICVPCGQYYVRKHAVLNGDMTKYKLWQGRHDGPHCLAVHCPRAPITIEAGTYGEQKCPNLFLCAEVTCLGGCFAPCCAFDVSRDIMKEERSLGIDPVEARFEKCQGFFGELMACAACTACCLRCSSCLLGCIATESDGAQELSGEARRLSSACYSLSRTCFRGMIAVQIMAIGCMSSQMIHEHRINDPNTVQEPKQLAMDRS